MSLKDAFMEGSLNIKVNVMKEEDWPAVKSIYQEGIDTKNATFETVAPDWNEWDETHLKFCRFVSINGDHIIGRAALSPVSERCIYSGVAEVSIYVSSAARGNGVGKTLLDNLITESEKKDIWTLPAGIFPENRSSIRLHAQAGFREVGYREKIGKRYGLWRDVIVFERRSKNF
jgi:L-amino acid N-acyltransferase YncA